MPRSRGTGPRATVEAACPHPLCRAGSPDPAPFGSGRARTTLAKVLEEFGYGVQCSVFEAHLSTQTRPVSEPPRGLSAREGEFSVNLLENPKNLTFPFIYSIINNEDPNAIRAATLGSPTITHKPLCHRGFGDIVREHRVWIKEDTGSCEFSQNLRPKKRLI